METKTKKPLDRFASRSHTLKESTTKCAHCNRVTGNFAGGFSRGLNGEPLCHPNARNRPDCYHLVTVYKHEIPCRKKVCYEDHADPKKYIGRAKPRSSSEQRQDNSSPPRAATNGRSTN